MRALAPLLALRCAAPPRRVLLRALTSDGENVHAAWTKEDDWKLWKHRDDADVAELLGRKAGGVAARLKKLEDPASTAAKRLFGEEQEETIDMDDYLALDDDALLRQCRVDYRRDSGTCSASTPFRSRVDGVKCTPSMRGATERKGGATIPFPQVLAARSAIKWSPRCG